MAHTPRPWTASPDDEFDFRIPIFACEGEIEETVAYACYANGFPAGERGQENARLIAAAPDLLAACEAAELSMDTAAMQGVRGILPPAYRKNWANAHEALRAAIAKARGK